MDVSLWGGSTPEDIRRRVGRGSPLVLSVDADVDMSGVSAVARSLQAVLPDDMLVIATVSDVRSASSANRALAGAARLTVLRLVAEEEAAALRPELDRLLADFRRRAGELVAVLRDSVLPRYDSGDEYPDEVETSGATWTIELHGEHCRFAEPVSGEVVEANIDEPNVIDPYFLLLFARTTGRHDAVRAACVEGYHDMVRMLELAGAGRTAR